MKQTETFEEMDIVLNELDEQFNIIKKNEGQVPQIEIDIMLSTVRRLYEFIGSLNKQTKIQQEKKQDNGKEESIDKKAEFAESEKNETKIIEAKNKTEIIEPKVEFVNSETDKTENEKVVNESVNSGTENDLNKNENTTNKNSGLLFQFDDEVFSVNDSVAKNAEDKSLVKKLSNKRIGNLKSAIGINDKFYFINELFNGNSKEYEESIFALNNFNRPEEAKKYLDKLKNYNKWDEDGDAYQKLLNFLERKFIEIDV